MGWGERIDPKSKGRTWDDPTSEPMADLADAAAFRPSREGREGDTQAMPTVNDHPDIQSQVIADIEARRQVGITRYGTALQPFNGRDALVDLYEELLDAAMYIKQRIIEDQATRDQVKVMIKALDDADADAGTDWLPVYDPDDVT